MSLSNREIAKRADIAIGDLTSGGLLLPEQANQFIDDIVDEPSILNRARVIRMSSPKRKIARTGFGGRIFKAAPQGTAPFAADDGSNDRRLLAADRAKITNTEIELDTKEVIAEIHIPYEVLEDNIERGGFEQHIMREMAKQAARDFEDWALNSDTASGDSFFALTDGLLKQATSNVVDNLSVGISPDLFEQGILTMPTQYLANIGDLVQFIPVRDETRYRANVAKRATGYGDSVLQANGVLNAFGTEVAKAPYMPASTGLFTFPNNIIWGIHRDIMVETMREIRARQVVIVVTARIDILFDIEAAVVKYTNI